MEGINIKCPNCKAGHVKFVRLDKEVYAVYYCDGCSSLIYRKVKKVIMIKDERTNSRSGLLY